MIDSSWRIMIADQSLCFLELLQLHLVTQPKITAVDIATTIITVDQHLKEHDYDLIVLGEHLADYTMLDAAHLILEQRPTVKLAAFCTSFNSGLLMQHNLNLIKNLISKKESLSSILLAIYRICKGESYITPYVQHLIKIDDKKNIVNQNISPITQLSPRQIKVLTLLANGLSVKEVAKELHLSPKSVDSHKYRLMLKLKIKDRVELARFAIREGLIDA